MIIDKLPERIQLLKSKYNLQDFRFDIECINNLGDLSKLLTFIVNLTLPEKDIKVTEKISTDGGQYEAVLSNQDSSLQIFAETSTDWLPDDFFHTLETIPIVFKSTKRFLSVNPIVIATIHGQDAWYFSGEEEVLIQARQEGLPLIFRGEDNSETEEFKILMDV